MHLSPQECHDLSKVSRRDFFEKYGYKWEQVEPIINLYKTYEHIQGVQDSVHHICSQSRGGRDVGTNRIVLPRKGHTVHHDYFDTHLPHEQPIVNMERNHKAIISGVISRFERDINRLVDRGEFYKPGVL